jgi:flagellar motor switch protein FliN/FliY
MNTTNSTHPEQEHIDSLETTEEISSQDGETGAHTSTEPPRTANLDMILDIPVQITVELGRAKMPIRDLLKLAQGSVIELDGLAGDPMKIYANGCLIARGEVIVMHDRFGIRLSDVVSQNERLSSSTSKKATT